jgi:hypothetical protein
MVVADLVKNKKPYLVRTDRAPVSLDHLSRMNTADLRILYGELFGSTVPAGNSEYARRKIAWQIQAGREGGLPESARQHALAIAQEASLRMQVRGGVQSPLPHATVSGIISDHDSRLPMLGSVIVKEFHGRTVVVRVLDSGFEYDDRRFTSLSAIAKAITGTKWNGFQFFGLAKESRRAGS